MLSSKTLNERLTFEIAMLRRFRFGRRGEQLPPGVQGSLLEEAVDEDLTEIEAQLAALHPKADPTPEPKGTPKRVALPPQLPRIEVRHEPHSATCTCGCQLKFVRDEVSEKLDYTPGAFTVERHVRPILACPLCEAVVQAPMPAYVIDKGLATPGLMAMCWWPNTPITCRSIARKASLPGRDCALPAPPWPNGWGPAALRCNHWWAPCARRSWHIACCMPMRHR